MPSLRISLSKKSSVCPGDDTEQRACNENTCPGNSKISYFLKLRLGAFINLRNSWILSKIPRNFVLIYEFINFSELTKWTPWTPCSKSCGSGERSRQRECKVPTIRSDNPCGNAPLRQRELCNTQKCPIYTEWSGWSMCSVSCGGGKQSRERACVLPPTSLRNIGCVEIRGFFHSILSHL